MSSHHPLPVLLGDVLHSQENSHTSSARKSGRSNDRAEAAGADLPSAPQPPAVSDSDSMLHDEQQHRYQSLPAIPGSTVSHQTTTASVVSVGGLAVVTMSDETESLASHRLTASTSNLTDFSMRASLSDSANLVRGGGGGGTERTLSSQEWTRRHTKCPPPEQRPLASVTTVPAATSQRSTLSSSSAALPHFPHTQRDASPPISGLTPTVTQLEAKTALGITSQGLPTVEGTEAPSGILDPLVLHAKQSKQSGAQKFHFSVRKK